MNDNTVKNRYILPARDRKFVTVHKNTHEAIRAFACVRNMTIVEATQYLLIKAIEKLKEENE